ncbi:NirD/YgiW/YdeI family stress tolerance protein [Photobacterium nomapromontoriensis]|uniref:NirD/YgiW/YdeI family stress tolerance protein n=1 Tax=Photobacterium nomapromontoriensis TaxID=2910237 RepID=UPI003D12C851
MNKSAAFALIAVLAIGPAIAMANSSSVAYNGPVDVTAISEVITNTGSLNDQHVIVEGTFVKQVGTNSYVLSDGVNQVTVDLDDNIRLDLPINADTRLRVFGEVGDGPMPEIEADNIVIL